MGPRSRSGHSLIQIYSKRFFLTIELKPKTGINIGVKHFTGEKIHLCCRFYVEMSTGGCYVHGWVLAKNRPDSLIWSNYTYCSQKTEKKMQRLPSKPLKQLFYLFNRWIHSLMFGRCGVYASSSSK